MKRKTLKLIMSAAAAASMLCATNVFAEETEATEETEVTEEYIDLSDYDYSDYTPAKDEYHFVFIPKLVHTWYEDVKAGIDEAVAELADKGITVTYTWDAPADAVVTDQISKMEAAAATQPDGISAAIIDPSATTAVINELVANGINVCTFDVDAPDSDRLFYCGHSTNYQDGWDIAEMTAEKIGGEGQIAILSGSLSAQNHIDRVLGFKECIAKNYPDIQIADEQPDNDSVEDALSITEGYIATYPDLKAVFGCNGAAPNGAARAVIDAGKTGEIIVTGMAEDAEAAGYVRDGVIYVTLKQKVPSYGYNSVYNMIMIADGVGPVTVNGDIPADFITAENVDEFDW